jgi:hypothetical protein
MKAIRVSSFFPLIPSLEIFQDDSDDDDKPTKEIQEVDGGDLPCAGIAEEDDDLV